ncbi:hypothetical protein NL108_012583 [Boleophthalmus pectinirostris]|uniref:zinc finger C2HC domain-containing protein 1C-like n=1 Tax=Boleophthalmus pectinirostris TaxID=150288 RepID=UPI00242B3388|nr:zinc finger C2HC domain-containing protein 1C-like [Boleophthalmus pectinirostris]KAJ0041606.1 hypothetical protein NL108_012583 [Boleophthalmus pectinirostris]
MNSNSRKPKLAQEVCGQGRSHFTPKQGKLTSKERDMEEKPFPIKPVCPKRLVKSKKSEDVPSSTSLGKDTSRLLAGELQMTKVIQEKQLMLQKKLWKVENALRERIQRDNADVNVYGGNQTVEKKHYERRQENVHPDTKTKQRTETTERHNPKQYNFKQDTITKKTEQCRETLTMRKEESSAKYIKSEQTQCQQKASPRLAIGEKVIAGKTLHEELNLPQISSTLSRKLELETPDKNIKLLPCSICKRTFMPDRLEKHMQICKKVKTTRRPVYKSHLYRIKGSDMEEFWKTKGRSRNPEVPQKKKQSQYNKT